MINNESYAVLYPYGTGSRSVKVFDDLSTAKKFLNKKANLTHIIAAPETVTICRLPLTRQQTLLCLLSAEDEERYISQVADLTETIPQWAAYEVWAEKLPNGEVISLGNCTNKNAPEPEQGGVVIKAWAVDDDPEVYESGEEAAQYNDPSQYLIHF